MADIKIFTNTETDVKVEGISGFKVADLKGLVQEVLMQILTPIGSYPEDSTQGSNIPKWLKESYNVSDITTFKGLVTTELAAIQSRVKLNQLGFVLNPKRLLFTISLTNAFVTNTATGMAISLTIAVKNVAGQTATVIIPA